MRRLASLLVALVLAGLPTAPAAGYDPVASGRTTRRLASSFAGLLRRSGVKLEGEGGVEVHGGAVTFPVAGGKLEPVEAKGTIEHAGRLVFVAGARRLPLRSLQLKTTRSSSPFAAKLGGGQLKLSTGARLTGGRRGFGTSFQATGMRLDKKLGLPGVFAEGRPFGAATTAVEPAIVGLAPAGKVELALDPAFAAKLASFFVAVNPLFPGERPGPFTFPIGGGILAPGGSTGLVKCTGGMEFIQVGGGQLLIKALELELARRPGGRRIPARLGRLRTRPEPGRAAGPPPRCLRERTGYPRDHRLGRLAHPGPGDGPGLRRSLREAARKARLLPRGGSVGDDRVHRDGAVAGDGPVESSAATDGGR